MSWKEENEQECVGVGGSDTENGQMESEQIMKEIQRIYRTKDVGLNDAAKAISERNFRVTMPRQKVTVLIVGHHNAAKQKFLDLYFSESRQAGGGTFISKVNYDKLNKIFITHGNTRKMLTGETVLDYCPHLAQLKNVPGLKNYLTTEIATRNTKSLISFILAPENVESATTMPINDTVFPSDDKNTGANRQNAAVTRRLRFNQNLLPNLPHDLSNGSPAETATLARNQQFPDRMAITDELSTGANRQNATFMETQQATHDNVYDSLSDGTITLKAARNQEIYDKVYSTDDANTGSNRQNLALTRKQVSDDNVPLPNDLSIGTIRENAATITKQAFQDFANLPDDLSVGTIAEKADFINGNSRQKQSVTITREMQNVTITRQKQNVTIPKKRWVGDAGKKGHDKVYLPNDLSIGSIGEKDNAVKNNKRFVDDATEFGYDFFSGNTKQKTTAVVKQKAITEKVYLPDDLSIGSIGEKENAVKNRKRLVDDAMEYGYDFFSGNAKQNPTAVVKPQVGKKKVYLAGDLSIGSISEKQNAVKNRKGMEDDTMDLGNDIRLKSSFAMTNKRSFDNVYLPDDLSIGSITQKQNPAVDKRQTIQNSRAYVLDDLSIGTISEKQHAMMNRERLFNDDNMDLTNDNMSTRPKQNVSTTNLRTINEDAYLPDDLSIGTITAKQNHSVVNRQNIQNSRAYVLDDLSIGTISEKQHAMMNRERLFSNDNMDLANDNMSTRQKRNASMTNLRTINEDAYLPDDLSIGTITGKQNPSVVNRQTIQNCRAYVPDDLSIGTISEKQHAMMNRERLFSDAVDLANDNMSTRQKQNVSMTNRRTINEDAYLPDDLSIGTITGKQNPSVVTRQTIQNSRPYMPGDLSIGTIKEKQNAIMNRTRLFSDAVDLANDNMNTRQKQNVLKEDAYLPDDLSIGTIHEKRNPAVMQGQIFQNKVNLPDDLSNGTIKANATVTKKGSFDMRQAVSTLTEAADLIFIFFDPTGTVPPKETLKPFEHLWETHHEKMLLLLARANVNECTEEQREDVLANIVREIWRNPTVRRVGYLPEIFCPDLSGGVRDDERLWSVIQTTADQSVDRALSQLGQDAASVLERLEATKKANERAKRYSESTPLSVYFWLAVLVLTLFAIWGAQFNEVMCKSKGQDVAYVCRELVANKAFVTSVGICAFFYAIYTLCTERSPTVLSEAEEKLLNRRIQFANYAIYRKEMMEKTYSGQSWK